MANFENAILRDIAANRPAAGIPGRLFYDTTNDKWQRDNGVTWEDCEPTPPAAYTDEQAQDAVGAMVADTDTIDITYTDATPELKADVKTQMSITADASGLKLDGDNATPGNNKVYGTDGSGVKGWKADPSGSSLTLLKSVWSPDAPPAFPTSQDDEYNDGSLDAKWSEFDPNNILTSSEDSTYKALFLTASTRGGENPTGLYQTIPAGDFTVWVKAAFIGPRANYQAIGLGLWENPLDTSKSIMGTLLTVDGGNITAEVKKWSNSTTYNANVNINVTMQQPNVYFRIRRNGSNYYHAFSLDGLAWCEYASAYNPIATPTKFGPIMNNLNSGQTYKGMFQFFRYVASDVGSMGMLAGQLAGIYQ